MESDGRSCEAEKVRCREIVLLYHFNHAIAGWVPQRRAMVDAFMRVPAVAMAFDG